MKAAEGMQTQGILAGNKLAVSRAISLAENGREGAQALMEQLAPHTGRALRIGITGPPGVGKSTLIDAVSSALKQNGESIGIIAIDPTSPFTGGALLGDRIRMAQSSEDSSIFIRSMATRGYQGGLSRAAYDTADILDASGKTVILVETVGVGQSEIEVLHSTDCVVVVFSPESGDGVQAMKSGLMEIADILAINKADRPGADKLEYEIRSAYEMGPKERRGTPLLLMEATQHKGVSALWAKVQEFVQSRKADGQFEARRRENTKVRLMRLIEFMRNQDLWENKVNLQALNEKVHSVLERKESIYHVAEKFLESIRNVSTAVHRKNNCRTA